MENAIVCWGYIRFILWLYWGYIVHWGYTVAPKFPWWRVLRVMQDFAHPLYENASLYRKLSCIAYVMQTDSMSACSSDMSALGCRAKGVGFWV